MHTFTNCDLWWHVCAPIYRFQFLFLFFFPLNILRPSSWRKWGKLSRQKPRAESRMDEFWWRLTRDRKPMLKVRNPASMQWKCRILVCEITSHWFIVLFHFSYKGWKKENIFLCKKIHEGWPFVTLILHPGFWLIFRVKWETFYFATLFLMLREWFSEECSTIKFN